MVSRRLLSKSLMRRRTIRIGHHKTSVTLEDQFWNGLKEIANERGLTVAALVRNVDADRDNANLCSAIRVFVLRHYQDRRNKRSRSA